MQQMLKNAKLAKSVDSLSQRLSLNAKGMEYQREIGEIVESLPEVKRRQLQGIFEDYLHLTLENEASDIDLGGPGCGGQVWYRIYGEKKPLEQEELSIRETDFLLQSILTPSQRAHLFENRNLDFSYTIDTDSELDQRFRATMYFDLEHLALNMRRIDNTIRPFKGLKMHPEVAKVLSLKYQKAGLTLVTGITGSGKSSTLDTIIDANNRTVDSHIVIIASPVELIHQPKRSVVRHREVGRDVLSFKEGVTQALRQDPDIIVIGELRDPETIIPALEITDSGHKTFGTLHTSSAMESIDRIVGEMPTNDQNRVRTRLADVLKCVISQKLVPSLDGKRVLAKEVLLVTNSVKAAIRNNNVNEIYQMLMEGASKGMNTLEQDLQRLVEEEKISEDVALNNANNKIRMEQLLTKKLV